MLRLIMELKGKLSHKLIKKSRFGDQYFDETMLFRSIDRNVSRCIAVVWCAWALH